jgi:hypothetical protein
MCYVVVLPQRNTIETRHCGQDGNQQLAKPGRTQESWWFQSHHHRHLESILENACQPNRNKLPGAGRNGHMFVLQRRNQLSSQLADGSHECAPVLMCADNDYAIVGDGRTIDSDDLKVRLG